MNVGIIGYGRFGAAMAQLARDATFAVQAIDPRAEVPDGLRAQSLEALCAWAELLVVAVPVPAMRALFGSLQPLLRPTQLVLDVGSVKVLPVAVMREVLGTNVPWVGTHPLFGPASLSRAERPLRVVVCPAPEHPEAADRAEALFQQLGCEVLRQTPEVHDRTMAQTHALTFFIAKALIDLGVGANLTFTPPSFRAIAHTIELVRVDAGHLFTSISRSNPFAAEARLAFMRALQASHDALGEVDGAEPPSPPLEIPDLGSLSTDLREAREEIDEVDRELLALLARRVELARLAGRAKRELGHPVHDPVREAALLQKRRGWAKASGLDEAQVEAVFRALLQLARGAQSDR
jgi:prephenate dehydrogenase